MRANTNLCGLIVMAGVLIPTAAAAQDPSVPAGTEPPPIAASTMAGYPDSHMRLGLNLVPMPLGTYEVGSTSGDLAVAFGVRAFFDYLITPNFFVGFGPTYTFNMKPSEGDVTASKALDLSLRLGGGAPVSDTIQLYGYLSPGYSFVFASGPGDDPKGFILGINAGAMYTLTPQFFLNGELGYQLGYQKVSNIDGNFKFMQIALGGGIRL